MALNTTNTMEASKEASKERVLDALSARRFFKLIGGGSLTDADKIARLLQVYATAGIDCIDIAPDAGVLAAIETVYAALPPEVSRPLVMVSIPLDPDPHFRKIELVEPHCIVCDACVPVCPTDAILNTGKIEIDQPLCYGCGRCVDVCPTQALLLHPFLQQEELTTVLSHPLVEAVEIHTQHVDPYMLDDFLKRHGVLLKDKLIALCFRPQDEDSEGHQPGAVKNQHEGRQPGAVKNWIAFCRKLKAGLPGFRILQIDGQPMSGTDDPAASLPSLRAACEIKKQRAEAPDLQDLFITLSGGINTHTARLLDDPAYAFIAGVGMGTVARRHVWDALGGSDFDRAQALAGQLVGLFRRRV